MDCITFQDTFIYGPILQSLIDHIQFSTLRNLQLTCRYYSDLYRYALPSKWNIDKHLARFLRNPKTFRQALDDCQAAVSGSFALQFFDAPTAWQSNDMDVYVMDSFAAGMHRHLIETQECILQSSKDAAQAKYPIDNIAEVRTYIALSRLTRRAEKIQLIVLEEDEDSWDCPAGGPLNRILADYHSTAVLNLITGKWACSLFPAATFIARKNFPCWPNEHVQRAPQNKYTERGYTLSEVRPRVEGRRALQPMRKARAIGDRFCWQIEFDVDGVSRPGRPFRAAALKSFPPFWWTMQLWPYHLSVPGDESYFIPPIAHYYKIKPRGPLRKVDALTYECLTKLSILHPAHEVSTGAYQPIVYCDCWRRENEYRRGVLECLRYGSFAMVFSVASVGSWSTPEELTRIAVGDDDEIEQMG